ncbi:MAG TPA: hypothetical protein DG753_08200 [Clostridium sp.]|nr:hypothetical protein [Clostridium sp.]
MKYINKVFAVFAMIIFVTSVCCCSATPTKSPSQAVEEMIESIKGGDNSFYKNMFNKGFIKIETDKNKRELFPESSVKLDNYMKNIDYTINSEKIDGDEAVVNVTLKGPELDCILQDIIKKLRSDFSSGELTLDDLNLDSIALKYDKYVSGILDNVKTSERTIDIKLVNKDGEWKLKNDDNIIKLTINIHPDEVKHIMNHI